MQKYWTLEKEKNVGNKSHKSKFIENTRLHSDLSSCIPTSAVFFSFMSLHVTIDDNFPDRYNFVQSFKLPSIKVVPDANILKPPPWDSEKRQECPPRADWQSCCLGLWVGACVCAGDGDWGRAGCSAVARNRERLPILSMTHSWRNWLTTIQHMHVWSTFCMDMSSQRWSTHPNGVLTFAGLGDRGRVVFCGHFELRGKWDLLKALPTSKGDCFSFKGEFERRWCSWSFLKGIYIYKEWELWLGCQSKLSLRKKLLYNESLSARLWVRIEVFLK